MRRCSATRKGHQRTSGKSYGQANHDCPRHRYLRQSTHQIDRSGDGGGRCNDARRQVERRMAGTRWRRAGHRCNRSPPGRHAWRRSPRERTPRRSGPPPPATPTDATAPGGAISAAPPTNTSMTPTRTPTHGGAGKPSCDKVSRTEPRPVSLDEPETTRTSAHTQYNASSTVTSSSVPMPHQRPRGWAILPGPGIPRACHPEPWSLVGHSRHISWRSP